MQVRSGHIPLNSSLFRIGKSDTKFCQVCDGEQGQEAAAETVLSLLLQGTLSTEMNSGKSHRLEQHEPQRYSADNEADCCATKVHRENR